MQFKEKNIALLRKRHPGLLSLYEAAGTGNIEPFPAKNGLPVFKFNGSAFHGLYRPEEEGARFAEGISADARNIWVFGLGYGYHLAGLMADGANVTVLEPSPEIFRSAIDNADLSEILDKCRLIIGGGFHQEFRNLDFKNAILAPHRPYLRFFEEQWLKMHSAFSVRSILAHRGLKVMLVGPIYGGSEPTFMYVKEALVGMGAEVVQFNAAEFAPGYFALDGITPNPQHREQLRLLYSNMLGEGIVAMADNERPDLILVLAQAPLDVGALARLRQLNVPLAFWFVEDFRTLKYWDRVAPYYDYFFAIQRGEFVEKLGMAGARRVSYLPQAASPMHHRTLQLSEKEKEHYGSALSFMGAGYHNRRMFFQGLLDYDFKIWGTEWDLSSAVGNRVVNRNIRMKPEEYTKVFCASKINLNLHSSALLSGIDPLGDFVNPRVFELASCRAFSLVDNRSELSTLFKVGKEIDTFSSLSELREKIDYYLADAETRTKMASAAQLRVLEDHTFENRMETLLAVVFAHEKEGFGGKHPPAEKPNSRNVVRNMMEEGAKDEELTAFLSQFDPEKELSLKEAVEKINRGTGKLNRSESLMLMVNELLVQD